MKEIIKNVIKHFPLMGDVIWKLRSIVRKPKPFPPGSAAYWEDRYAADGNSGAGSYGIFASFKADILNDFVNTHDVKTVIEFGCGDGNQLGLVKYPVYTGFDVSSSVVSRCSELYKSDTTKSFRLLGDYNGDKAELVLSLDVIYHLVEDSVFEDYMRRLFSTSDRYVIIYSSDTDLNQGYEGTYIKHRKFTKWVKKNFKDWKLVKHIPNKYPYQGDYRTGSFADFFIYEKS